jgi:hypothetical protein
VSVAFVPYVPPQSPSPRAQELGQRVALTIAEFRQKYPDLSDEEIREALLSAASPSSSGTDRPAAALGAIAAAVAVVAGLGVYLFARSRDGPADRAGPRRRCRRGGHRGGAQAPRVSARRGSAPVASPRGSAP